MKILSKSQTMALLGFTHARRDREKFNELVDSKIIPPLFQFSSRDIRFSSDTVVDFVNDSTGLNYKFCESSNSLILVD